MNHIILDKNVFYDNQSHSYYFRFDNGYKSDYIKVDEMLPIDSKTKTLPKNSFRISTNNHNSIRIKYGRDTTQTCLVFFSCDCSTEYEYIELVEDETYCKVLEVYDTYDSTKCKVLKVVAILSPRKPFVVKYINSVTGKSRYEVLVYDAINEKVLDRKLTSDEFSKIEDNAHDDPYIYNIRFDNNPDDINRATEYYNKYHSSYHN